ncbi:MAG: A/G-specific adenine glycosylase [Rhodospirillales bacterium]|nr:A/G-specific adenine glycosylase [Rhodospirillales bacterium]
MAGIKAPIGRASGKAGARLACAAWTGRRPGAISGAPPLSGSLRVTAIAPASAPFAAAPPASALLGWYDRNRRSLPWRAAPGEVADPYRVWLSEIMLQQTNVVAVIPYYEAFVSRFPRIAALAAAEEQAVLSLWAGLGYYARARNLHACARIVAAQGGFPDSESGLRALPGIGAYTAAAIAAIAFQRPAVPIDGNVARILSRVFMIDLPLARAGRILAARAADLGADRDARARPGDFAQALFDLGAAICTPTSPDCSACPWRDGCGAFAAGRVGALPVAKERKTRPLRHGVHFWLEDGQGRVLLRRRAPEGLLGGMSELPGTPWRAAAWSDAEALAHAPAASAWTKAGAIRHVFTHFELHLTVFVARIGAINPDEGFLAAIATLDAQALPSVMMKCVRAAQSATDMVAMPAPPPHSARKKAAKERRS